MADAVRETLPVGVTEWEGRADAGSSRTVDAVRETLPVGVMEWERSALGERLDGELGGGDGRGQG